MHQKKWFASSVLVFALFGSNLMAQTPNGLDFERFHPVLDSQGLVLTESGEGQPAWNFNLGLWLHYDRNPLAFYEYNHLTRALVSDRLTADLVGSIGFTNWLQIGLDIPLVAYQSGDNPDRVSGLNQGLSAVSFRDIVISPKVRVVSQDRFPISIALLLPISLPSGDQGEFTGSKNNNLTATPTLAISKLLLGKKLLLAANLGFWIRPEATYADLQTGNEMVYRLGAGYWLTPGVQATGELQGMSELSHLFKNPPNQVNLEGLVGARIRLGKGFSINTAVGFPLQWGWGTPNYRLITGLIWSPGDKGNDRDGDGVADESDLCPDEPGVIEFRGCKTLDRDRDGVADSDDACPDQAGPRENRGCPWGDRDGDKISDNLDQCPDEPGVPEKMGCPIRDADKDGVADDADKCPNEPGPVENQGCPFGDRDGDSVPDNLDKCPDLAGEVALQGCPKPDADNDMIPDDVDQCPTEPGKIEDQGCPPGKRLVVIHKTKVELKEKLYFNVGTSTIQEKSFALLDQVAEVLRVHAEITKIRIDGHTDSTGPAEFNLVLSQKRAQAVADYLVGKGVEPTRLEAKGYGAAAPIASNNTKQGRETNRRVEFNIAN